MPGASVSIKILSVLWFFLTYKYFNAELHHLKILSTLRTNIRKHSIVLSVAEKIFKLEFFVIEYGELLIFL